MPVGVVWTWVSVDVRPMQMPGKEIKRVKCKRAAKAAAAGIQCQAGHSPVVVDEDKRAKVKPSMAGQRQRRS